MTPTCHSPSPIYISHIIWHTFIFQVKVDMGEPILSGPEIPTKLPATRNKAVVQAELEVEGSTWHVTCVSMGNPHCVTFGSKELKVINL